MGWIGNGVRGRDLSGCCYVCLLNFCLMLIKVTEKAVKSWGLTCRTSNSSGCGGWLYLRCAVGSGWSQKQYTEQEKILTCRCGKVVEFRKGALRGDGGSRQKHAHCLRTMRRMFRIFVHQPFLSLFRNHAIIIFVYSERSNSELMDSLAKFHLSWGSEDQRGTTGMRYEIGSDQGARTSGCCKKWDTKCTSNSRLMRSRRLLLTLIIIVATRRSCWVCWFLPLQTLLSFFPIIKKTEQSGRNHTVCV